MKKPNKRKDYGIAPSSVAVIASLLEIRLLKNLVENLANRRSDLGYSKEKLQEGWEAVETSSIEAYVSGNIKMSDKSEELDLPFNTCFMFSCTKPNNGVYDLAWCSSLS